MRTKSVIAMLALLLMAILLPLSASGQDNPQSTSNTKDKTASSSNSADQGEGVTHGDWNIQQSVELGYRFTRSIGNDSFFQELVGVNQGPRLLSQDLSVRSMTHTGAIFDNLYISSFGWGGDPNNAVRFNISKVKAYNFSGSWRRDQNYFDYNLLANPLNPPTTGTPAYPNASVNFSPHALQLRRRNTDLALTLLPQSAVSIRLGYVRNNMTGPSLSSFHEGTDVLLFQPWDTTLDGYRIGIDFKVLPKTIISYDQYLDYFKNDTDWMLQPFATFTTATGVPVEFGLPWNVPARQPCAAPFIPAGSTTANAGCSGYQGYNRFHRYRTKQPTEQLTIQSNYLNHVDFVASGRYSTNDYNDALNESMLGVVVRPGVNERAFTLTGPVKGRRLTTDIDLGATLHVTDKFRVPITYRFLNWRNEGSFDSVETIFSPLTPAVIGGDVGVPAVTPDLFQIFFGNKQHELQAELEYDFTKHIGAHVGTRYTRRYINHRDFAEDEGDITKINDYTGLAGIWIRARNSIRFNLDTELSSADNFLTRITPRNQQRYRARLSVNPKPWALASAYANFWEMRNGDAAIRYKGRNRNAGVTLDVTPNQHFGIDLAYNFNLWSQNSNVCFTGSVSPPGTTPTDPADPCGLAGLPLQVYSLYNNHTHYGSIAFYVSPVKRFTANFGYSVTNTDGTMSIFNPLQPLGPLTSTYHQPLLNFAIGVSKDVTFNLGYNYFGYNEASTGISQIPRNFHANITTLSLKYAF